MSEHLIDPATWTPNQRRQADMMVAFGSWSSRTCGAWVEDGCAAFKTEAAFGPDMVLELGCDDLDDHEPSLDLGCLFVDNYREFRPTKAGDRIAGILDRIDRRYGGPVTVGTSFAVDTPLAPFRACRLDTAEGFAVAQRRYLAAGAQVCGVDTWTLAGQRPREGQTRIGAIVVGERAGEIVALIMPMAWRDEAGQTAIGEFEPAAAPPARAAADGRREDDWR